MKKIIFENEFLIFCILLLFTFLSSPIFGVLLSFFILFYYSNDKNKVFVVFFFISLFIGLLNSLKVPESDMERYLENYNYVQYFNLYDYLFVQIKEPVFFIFNYITYHIFSGSTTIYIISHSLISYFLIFYSIWRCHERMKLGKYNFLLAVAVAFLFPNLFSVSAHLMRQFLAGSIVLYVIIEYAFHGKIKIMAFVLAIFTHTTAALFVLIFLPFFNKRISFKNISIISFICIFFMLSVFQYSNSVYDLLGEIPFVGYAFSRISNREGHWETKTLGFDVLILYFFTLFILFRESIRLRFRKDNRFQVIFYINLLLCIFVLINYDDTEMALRFSFYLYFFLPIAFYFFSSVCAVDRNKKINKISFIVVVPIFFLWFIYKLQYGTWTYNNIVSLTNFSWITEFHI